MGGGLYIALAIPITNRAFKFGLNIWALQGVIEQVSGQSSRSKKAAGLVVSSVELCLLPTSGARSSELPGSIMARL